MRIEPAHEQSSEPDFEQQECVNKAEPLFRAAEEARRFASAARRGR